MIERVGPFRSSSVVVACIVEAMDPEEVTRRVWFDGRLADSVLPADAA